MGYSKRDLSTISMLYSLKKKYVTLHRCLPVTATSPQQLLSSIPKVKVAVVERFDCQKK